MAIVRAERDNQADIRKQASLLNNWAWRNNNGACKTAEGRQIRYGLGNDSKQINKVFKSSDLIGLTPYLILPSDVGKVVGIFTAIEVKRSDWKYRNTPEERAQLTFLQKVQGAGGLAGFARNVADYLTIISRR